MTIVKMVVVVDNIDDNSKDSSSTSWQHKWQLLTVNINNLLLLMVNINNTKTAVVVDNIDDNSKTGQVIRRKEVRRKG